MADIEDLQIQFQMLLCQASMDVVRPMAERLGIEKANWIEKKSQKVGLLFSFVDGCGIIALTLCYMKYLYLYNILGTL
jgi:uncharacterized Fe-S cluster protein YjdI